jgi:hypothetical protein
MSEEYCRLCGCDVFECGGNVTDVCTRNPSPPAAPELPEGWLAIWHVPRVKRLVRVIREHRKEDYLEWVYLDGPEKGVVTTGHWDALWSVMDMVPLLATQGLSIVDAKDRAVLEACAKLDPIPHLFMAGSGMTVADADRVMQAELARRKP